jgi:hypothetical protein
MESSKSRNGKIEPVPNTTRLLRFVLYLQAIAARTQELTRYEAFPRTYPDS